MSTVFDTILVWGIRIVHMLIVVAVVISVVVPSCVLKDLALIVLIYLMIQYLLGVGKCCLTELEYMILGQDKYQQGFMYRMIKPVISVPENYFNNGLFVFHIAWIMILCYQVFSRKCS